MGIIRLHGLPKSSCTRRVAAVFKEKGVPYELVPVNVFSGAHKDKTYIETMQPFGQVPVMDDNGYFLHESRAIARYIALKFADQGTPNLVPAYGDLEGLGRFEQACSIECSQFNDSAERWLNEAVFKKIKGIEPDEAAAEKYAADLAAKLDGYEIILGRQKYLAGDHVTLADLFHLPYGDFINNALGSDVMSSRPNVARWWKDISLRESWTAVKDGA